MARADEGLGYRPLGGGQAPPEPRSRVGISPTGRRLFFWPRAPALGQSEKRGPASGTRSEIGFFPGVCGNEKRPTGRKFPNFGLDTLVRGGRGELHRVNLDVQRPCSAPSSVGSGRIGPENELQGRLSARTWSRRLCIMSRKRTRCRKINTKPGRRAARERVRELVSEHDDQVVLLIWGGRVLGWSLRRIAASLKGSIAPPGRRAGYAVGKWTAAAVQRICRRHGIPTDRPADPPRVLLDSLRRGAGPRQ